MSHLADTLKTVFKKMTMNTIVQGYPFRVKFRAGAVVVVLGWGAGTLSCLLKAS